MQYYFFSTPDKVNATPFRQFAIKQNVAISNILSTAIIGLCLVLFLLKAFVDYGHAVSNTREYRDVLLFLLGGSVIYRSLFFIVKKKIIKNKLTAYWILSSYYALVIACGFMWLTFIAQHNPRNTMTMFMAGMFGVAMLWILDLIGTMSIAAITLALFIFCLHNFQGDNMVLWQNYFAAFIVLLLFFIISRILYSYHFRYFMQLKTIEEKNKEIGKIYRNQTDILNMVAHDIRSPLNSITALINIMQHPSTTEEEKKEFYDLILSACKDADHTLHDLIDAAKKKENTLIDKETIPINGFLESIKDQWEHRLTAERKLVYNNPGKEILAPVNKQKLQRVLDNLISNAVKFTPNDGVIRMDLCSENNKVRISISDNGIGIPSHLQPYIFDRFTKASRNGLYGEKSYGLGLSICQQIIEQHKGSITVQSKEKEGTTFYIDLPMSNN